MFPLKTVIFLLAFITFSTYAPASEHRYVLPSGTTINIIKPDEITLEQVFSLTSEGLIIAENVEVSYEFDNQVLSSLGLFEVYSQNSLIHVISEWMLSFLQENQVSPSQSLQTNPSAIALIDPYLGRTAVDQNFPLREEVASLKESVAGADCSNSVSINSSTTSSPSPSPSPCTRGKFKCIFKDCCECFTSPNLRCNHHKNHLIGFNFNNACPLCSLNLKSIANLL